MHSPSSWQKSGKFGDFLGREIFVIEANRATKDTVILLHGFPTSSYDWAAIWNRLAEDYHVVALDMLGFGISEKPYPHTYSIIEQADIVDSVVKALDVSSAHILAHDYGDTVTQELLARDNDGLLSFNIRSTCFLNGGLFPETHQALLIQKLLLSPLGPLVNKLTNKKRFDKSFSSVFGPNTKPSERELQIYWDFINLRDGRHIFHSAITYMTDRKNNRSRWIHAINAAKGPIALINGSCDPVSGAHMVARFKELSGEPDYLLELPEIGHYPQVEAPEAVSEAYLEFLG